MAVFRELKNLLLLRKLYYILSDKYLFGMWGTEDLEPRLPYSRYATDKHIRTPVTLVTKAKYCHFSVSCLGMQLLSHQRGYTVQMASHFTGHITAFQTKNPTHHQKP